MSRPIVHGIAGSPFVNSVRLTLDEKGVDYVFAEMPFGTGAHKAPEHLARHPFGRIPVLEHDGFLLYETQAIMRYVDRAFAGPALQPSDVRALARMDQLLNINDWYVFPSLGFGIAFQRLIVPQMGGTPDEDTIAAALPQARVCLSEIERLMGDGVYLAGDALSLADLIMAPPFGYFVMTPESRELLKPHARLNAWWARMSARDSLQRARPKAA
jgi:glutathione S-transferase